MMKLKAKSDVSKVTKQKARCGIKGAGLNINKQKGRCWIRDYELESEMPSMKGH